jgi:hypothetical protein
MQQLLRENITLKRQQKNEKEKLEQQRQLVTLFYSTLCLYALENKDDIISTGVG